MEKPTDFDELRNLVNSVRSIYGDMSLLTDEGMYKIKSKLLVAKQMDFLARQLNCISDNIKNTAYDLSREKANV